MDVKEKLVELLEPHVSGLACEYESGSCELTSCRSCNARNIADHLIAHGVTVQEWISVGSPPKKPGDYLCYFKYEPESPNIICQNTYYGSGRWMSEQDRVTHWSYLPEPPKGE